MSFQFRDSDKTLPKQTQRVAHVASCYQDPILSCNFGASWLHSGEMCVFVGNHRKLTGRSQANTAECVAGRLILPYCLYFIHLKCLEGLKSQDSWMRPSQLWSTKRTCRLAPILLWLTHRLAKEPELMDLFDSTLHILVDPNHLSKLYVNCLVEKTFKLVVTTAFKHHMDWLGSRLVCI